jgi:hypothetical protein
VGLDGLQPILLKVYRGTAAGQETLLGAVDAVVGVGADGITPILTTSIVDTGVTLIAQNGTAQPANFPGTYQGGNPGKFPPATGQENIFLVARDKDYIYRPYVRELEPLDVYPTTASPDSLPYAVVADTVLALRAPKFIGGLYRVNTSL